MKPTISMALITFGLAVSSCGLPAKDKAQYENKINWAESDYEIQMAAAERFLEIRKEAAANGIYGSGEKEMDNALEKGNRSWRYAKCLKQWRDENRRFIDAQAACMEQEGVDLSG